MNQKSVRSAVVISPPEKFWPQIQEIRRNHDKAYARWMPHINLLYPFVPEAVGGFSSEVEDIGTALRAKKVEPFPVLFSKESFGYFKHGKRCTIWLKPLQLKPMTSRDTAQTGLKVKETKAASRKFKSKHVQLVDYNASPHPPKEGGCVRKSVPHPRGHAVGLEHLAGAVWEDHDLHDLREPPLAVDVGIDCLRYAVWSPGDADKNQGVMFVDRISGKTSLGEIAQCQDHTETQLEEPDCGGEKQAMQDASEDKVEYKCLNTSAHPEVMRMQKCLVGAFPFYNDLNTKSPEGFQPHLTLAQCDERNVESFMGDLKYDWKDLCFIVDCVHIISRINNDPFVIKDTVKLGLPSL